MTFTFYSAYLSMAIDIHRLSTILRHANSSPPSHARAEFYALKEAICRAYGTLEGYDVQLIEHSCWGDYDGCGPHCGKCGGSGIYYSKTVLLEQWRVGKNVFHRPLDTQIGLLKIEPTIRGKITHRPSKLAFACWRVLTLLFNPQWHLWLDLWRMSETQLRQFKAVLGYAMGVPRANWKVRPLKFDDVQLEAAQSRINAAIKQAMPF